MDDQQAKLSIFVESCTDSKWTLLRVEADYTARELAEYLMTRFHQSNQAVDAHWGKVPNALIVAPAQAYPINVVIRDSLPSEGRSEPVILHTTNVQFNMANDLIVAALLLS